MSKPILSIIIPTIGNADLLEATLACVDAAISGKEIEVIVVDDSKDGVVADLLDDILLLRSFGKGASNARNKGWREAQSDLLLFLDDDILISKENIERTLALHQGSGRIAYNFFWTYPDALMKSLDGFKFGKYVIAEGLYSNTHRLKGLSLQPMTTMEGLTSQYFSIEKKWMHAVGGYDDIPFAGIEDLLLFKKLKKVDVSVVLSKEDHIFQNEANRMSVDKLCGRYRTGALTRRIAVLRGHVELSVSFSQSQMLKGKLVLAMLPGLKWAVKILPFGYVYRKAIHLLLFVSTYEGFYQMDLPSPYAEEFRGE